LAAKRAGVPVRICHNHSTAHWGEGIKTLAKYVLRLPSRLAATDYFACGEDAGRWMFGNRLFNAGQVFVLPSAIAGEDYAFDAKSRADIRRGLGLDEDSFVVGHVGRFCYPKNHLFLLDIFAAIKRLQPKAVLLLIGEGELLPRIEEAAHKLRLTESVKFLGVKQDLGAWYSAMDVFLMPSFYEGLGIVGLEAQANGLPCVFSNNVPAEVLLAENVDQLSLKLGPETWAQKALHASRIAAAPLPESYAIDMQAKTLAAAYRHLTRRALGPRWDDAAKP